MGTGYLVRVGDQRERFAGRDKDRNGSAKTEESQEMETAHEKELKTEGYWTGRAGLDGLHELCGVD